MLSHYAVWSAIDRLAEKVGLSPSALARRAGLDPTTFNRSKRHQVDGRERWPSTESIAKVLQATDTSLEDFVAFAGAGRHHARNVPIIGFAQAGSGGYFDDSGMPAGTGWDEVSFPDLPHDSIYALEIQGDSMLPAFRDGDRIIVSPAAPLRRGDRVVVRTRDGEVMAKELARQTNKTIELKSLNPAHPDRTFSVQDIAWIGRIMWVSQ